MKENQTWDPKKKLSYLPSFPLDLFLNEANLLYLDLINNHLEIGLAPAPEPQFVGHKIRVVKSFNPPWYSKIYYYHNRGKRRLFEKSLERIISLKDRDFNERNYKFNYDFF